jgi:hypothetical protein
MTAKIEIIWNPQNGNETTILYSPKWHSLSRIEKLDCLNDALGELTEQYNLTLTKRK